MPAKHTCILRVAAMVDTSWGLCSALHCLDLEPRCTVGAVAAHCRSASLHRPPLITMEAANNDNGKAPHSSWRNYDDFNEYFWSLHCFELSWPWRKTSSFFQKPQPRSKKMLISGSSRHQGKTSFVEHRTFFHLYHSFHRLWIFLFMMFQGLTIIAFNDGNLNAKTLREVLSLGPTFVVMKFFESVLDVFMMYGAYSTTRRLAVSRIFLRFLWFSLASVFITFLYVKALQEESKRNANTVIFRLYVIVIGIYAGVQFLISFLMRIPACHRLTNQCDRLPLIRFVKWMRQERHYVGRGMYERSSDFIKYMLFWLVILSGKFAFAYFLQIRPLVDPTKDIIKETNIDYSWHDFVSKNNHNALTVISIWAPVFAIYLLDIYVFYTLVSAVWGFLLGARDRLGEIRSLEALHKLFEQFPEAFMETLHVPLPNRSSRQSSVQVVEKNKVDAARFAPFWNEIIRNLREEDYITSFEMELLLMPWNSGDLPLVQWPLFLLASKIFLARDIAVESKDTQDELWDRISRDDYMMYAVQECYYAIKHVLTEILDDVGRKVERVYDDINASITKRTFHEDFQLKKFALVISRVTALMGILKETETPELERGAVRAVQDLYDVVRLDVLTINMRENYDTWSLLIKARDEGHLFEKLKWPKNADLKMLVKRLYSLLTIKESASSVPKNLEARRRLQFFTNSLFMKMPRAKPVREMLSFSVFTPYYSETVLYSMAELLKKNEDGISILFYLQKIYPDEWKNFLARIGRDENTLESELYDSPSDILELRFWASYRGQTLARTVRGMMYYRKALMLQTYLERTTAGDLEAAIGCDDEVTDTHGFELSPEARAQADLKFTYVVTCQIYGKQKEEQKPEAADIALLMQRNEALRVAFIDVVETLKDGKVNTEYYSKLVKADINGKDKFINFE
ncbi:Callose synthase 9, partial [Mucuna pruriens]